MKSKTRIREDLGDYFPGFIIPVEFEVADLPRLWKEQHMDRRYEATLLLNEEGNPEVREGPPAPAVDEINPCYKQPELGHPRKENNDINRYWKRQGA